MSCLSFLCTQSSQPVHMVGKNTVASMSHETEKKATSNLSLLICQNSSMCSVYVRYAAESCLMPNSVSALFLQLNILPYSCIPLLLVPACNLLCFYLLLFSLLGQGFAFLKLSADHSHVLS